jgi:hypothetical protein
MANVLNTIYEGDFCNKSGEDIFIKLKKRMPDTDPVPDHVRIIFSGEENEALVIEYSDKGDIKSVPIYGSGCSLNIIAEGDFELSSLYTADEREWKIEISGAWNHSSWLIPDSCSEPYASKPYPVSVKGTDAVGTLESVPFLQEDGTKYKGFIKDIDVLRFALQKTDLDLGFSIAINTFEDSMNTLICPLAQSYINVDAFVDTDGNAFSCLEVIRSIAERWFAQLHQFNGRWQLVNILEKSKGVVNCWNFSSAGVTEASTTLGNEINAGGITEELQPVGDVSFAKALASSTAYYRYGYPANQLVNGNMDTWSSYPTGLPDGWITQGGAVAHTETRMVPVDDNDPDGPQKETTDHYIVIDSSGSSGRIFNNNGVSIRATEQVTVNFDMQVPGAPGGASLIFLYLGVLISDGAGNYFTAENGWQSGFAFYVIRYRSGDFGGQVTVNFKVNSRDSDYTLYFGVQSLQEAGPADYATKINNVQVTPAVTADQTKPPVGIYNRQKTLTKQTYTKDPILLLHGDEPNNKRTSQISIGFPPPIVPSDKWKRAGITESESLLHIVANSELITHSQPYNILEANFIGFGQIDINTLLSVTFLPGKYIFLSGRFDLKKDERKLRFAQVLTEQIPFTEEVKEDYGTEKDKNGVSVGTPTGVNSPSSGGANIDLTGYALSSDIPVKASAIETSAGTNDDKFITPFKLLGWWTNIKTLAATISGLWNFTTRPTYNGAGLITLSDLPAPVDISGKANIASPTFTGDPKAPTPASGDNDNSIATTQFVQAALSLLKGSDTVLIKNAAYTVLVTDFGSNGNVTLYVDTTSGNIAITLPTAANMDGYTANIIKTSSDVNSVVVTATINGITNDLLSNQYDAGTYKSNGSLIFKF